MKRFFLFFFCAVFAFAITTGCDRSEPQAEPRDPEEIGKELAEAMVGAMADAMKEGLVESVEQEIEEKSLEAKARQLAELRNRIKEAPEKVEAILEKAGLSEEELEDLLFQIAEDPEASAAYVEAL